MRREGMNEMQKRIDELKEKIIHWENKIDKGIYHKDEDIFRIRFDKEVHEAELKGIEFAKKGFLKMIDEWSSKIKKEEEGSGFEQYYDLRIDELKQQLEGGKE